MPSLNTRLENIERALTPKLKGLQWVEPYETPDDGFIGVRWLTAEEAAKQGTATLSGRYAQKAD